MGILYPEGAEAQPLPVRQGCLCLLQVLQVLLREERRLSFDPRLDFAFCTEEELAGSFLAEEYRQLPLPLRRGSTSTSCCGWDGRSPLTGRWSTSPGSTTWP